MAMFGVRSGLVFRHQFNCLSASEAFLQKNGKKFPLEISCRHADCFLSPVRNKDRSSENGGEGMATGLWTSVSGAEARSKAVDVIANNLANQDTLGFKKDTPTFKEYLSTVERVPSSVDIPR